MSNDNGLMFSNLMILVVFIAIVSVAGLIAGIIYYDMAIVENVLKTVDFPLPIQNNQTAVALNMTTFQDILGVVVYPILDLKSTLPYLTYFLVFALIIALGISAYLSSKNTIFFIVHVLFTLVMTYFCIIISNTCIGLMKNPFINQVMVNFVIYNKLMFYLPQILFFTSLVFGAIAFINLIKPQTANTSVGLQYGGDY